MINPKNGLAAILKLKERPILAVINSMLSFSRIQKAIQFIRLAEKNIGPVNVYKHVHFQLFLPLIVKQAFITERRPAWVIPLRHWLSNVKCIVYKNIYEIVQDKYRLTHIVVHVPVSSFQ